MFSFCTINFSLKNINIRILKLFAQHVIEYSPIIPGGGGCGGSFLKIILCQVQLIFLHRCASYIRQVNYRDLRIIITIIGYTRFSRKNSNITGENAKMKVENQPNVVIGHVVEGLVERRKGTQKRKSSVDNFRDLNLQKFRKKNLSFLK